MTRLLALAVLLSGCSLINDFDKFTFSSGTRETARRDASAGSALDAGDLPGIDSGLGTGDSAAPAVTDSGALERDAQSSSEPDAGINKPDGGWCFDCSRFACPSLNEPSPFVPGAKAQCPMGTPGNYGEMGPCRVSCEYVPGSKGSRDGMCWDCQISVCGDLGQMPEGEASCPSTTQGYNMLGPCRVPCE